MDNPGADPKELSPKLDEEDENSLELLLLNGSFPLKPFETELNSKVVLPKSSANPESEFPGALY
jgi:hypothetical protein